jgi:hypothetical protein
MVPHYDVCQTHLFASAYVAIRLELVEIGSCCLILKEWFGNGDGNLRVKGSRSFPWFQYCSISALREEEIMHGVGGSD